MEHTLPFDPVRPWRTAALVAGGVAAIELVVLVAGGLALAGRPLWRHIGSTAVRKHRTAVAKHRAPAPLPSPVPHLARARTTVLVLNGNGRQGAAAAEAALVREHGLPAGVTFDRAPCTSGEP